MPDYVTITGEASGEFALKKSRFIGCCRHVEKEEEALAFIGEQKKKYWDASHHVFAYLLSGGQKKRCSDDGEPQGTAGVPVLDVLEKNGVSDLCMVVIRYFGGTLLGASGLVRAYTHGAVTALEAASRVQMVGCRTLILKMDYSFYGPVAKLLPCYHIRTEESDFGEKVTLKLLLPNGEYEAFCNELIDQTNGAVKPEPTGEIFAAFPYPFQ